MGAYLDRLNAQYDEIREGIETLVTRAADEGRDVSPDEETQVTRDQARLDQLTAAIEHYTALDTQHAKVAALRSSAPTPTLTRPTVPDPEPYDLNREFPSVADWAITVHRAMVYKDPEARAKLDRATAHQKTADNPGLIPRPILGPVLDLLNASRPFINSITRRPLPTGKFDRPTITQHVAVDVQAAEKDLTASQKMVVGLLPVAAKTYAGHLNISRQDVKWTSPGILQIVFDDFAAMYALRTCDDASDQFVASVTGTPVASGGTPAGVKAALFGAMSAALTAHTVMPDTLWVAPDVWAELGGMTIGADQSPAFPTMSLTNQGGGPLGIRMVVEPHFAAGTAIVGPSSLVEWYEDVDGLMQVQEPDVLGQLVGYAGFGAFLNLAPTAFVPITGIVTP